MLKSNTVSSVTLETRADNSIQFSMVYLFAVDEMPITERLAWGCMLACTWLQARAPCAVNGSLFLIKRK